MKFLLSIFLLHVNVKNIDSPCQGIAWMEFPGFSEKTVIPEPNVLEKYGAN
jgi:hypothetical protein